MDITQTPAKNIQGMKQKRLRSHPFRRKDITWKMIHCRTSPAELVSEGNSSER